ncbi:transposase [Arthrobacter sp. STN4]|uniref:transposase n=1 Tax=Arthrobacter sp. STN4 TaxID=2923276 RepID=UPI0035C0178A
MEPADHAIGRSRGGLTTKIHALVDGNQRPLVQLLGPGQGGDSPMFENLMEALKVEREGRGRARTRPDRAMADKAYSSKAIRAYLRESGIECVIDGKGGPEGQPTAQWLRWRQAGQLRQGSLQTPQRRRAQLQRAQAMAVPGHRYGKLALTYRSAVVLQSVAIWSSALGDTP